MISWLPLFQPWVTALGKLLPGFGLAQAYVHGGKHGSWNRTRGDHQQYRFQQGCAKKQEKEIKLREAGQRNSK